MKRGGFGKPYRKPAGGWPVKVAPYSGYYQHKNPALNGLTKFVNTTQVYLQPNQIGRPMTRPVQNLSGCENNWENGLPKQSWIGSGADQYLTSQLPALNQFTPKGTNDKGNACRLRGFKNVQAYRQWHGVFPWTSHDGGGCADTICLTQINDASGNAPGSAGYVPTYSSASFESPQPSPSQTKYLTVSVAATMHSEDGWFDGYYGTNDSSASGSVSIDASSGKKTSSLLTTEVQKTQIRQWDGSAWQYSPNVTTRNISGGAGDVYVFDGNYLSGWTVALWAHYNSGATTGMDALCSADPHCGSIPCVGIGGVGFLEQSISDLVGTWNNFIRSELAFNAQYPGTFEVSASDLLPEITNPNSYTGSYSKTYSNGDTEDLHIEWNRSATVFSWTVTYDYTPDLTNNPGGLTRKYSFSGTLTLSNPNTSASVKADEEENLMSFWDLTDDNLYPWRQDGLWQIAPLVTRDEAAGDVSPVGFFPSLVDDLRSPITDMNGNAPFTTPQNPPPPFWTYSPNNNAAYQPTTNAYNPGHIVPSDADHPAVAWDPTYSQMDWFDPAAYGFRWPAGQNQGASAAGEFVQYALTGKIFGMPLPLAFTSSESGLYQAGFTPPAKYDFQNFFDYRAQVWKALQWDQDEYGNVTCGAGPYVDFYQWGWGEWLYDAIMRTGAQLPHCATQWTNNYQAMSVAPYAYIIQADKQTYDKNGTPAPDKDFYTGPGGLMAQKFAEILEVWPSYDFSRPAAADKFSYDETLVVCTDGATLFENDGTTALTTDPGVTIGIWGGKSVNGFYSGCSMDGSGNLTLGTKWFDVPSDWASASGDTATAFGKLRFPTAPAIFGCASVSAVTDLGATRLLTTDTLTCLGLVNGTNPPDAVDICDANMTVLASNYAVQRIKPWQPSTAYALGDLVVGSAGNVEQCNLAGTSGTSEPAWPGTLLVTTFDNSATWLSRAVGLTADNYFKVTPALATIAAAKFIVSHGAANYEWNDNQRKGDFVMLDWTFDYRTNGEAARLYGATDCSGAAITPPATNYGFSAWHQTQYENTTGLKYTPCKPLVVCVSPNGENFGTHGVTIPFPTLNFDSRYGARWQMELESCQTDLLWQTPHRRCGLETTDGWRMDDGSCPASDPINKNGGTDYLYAHPALFEARCAVPTYGGTSETDTAPTPPTGIGYGNPVTTADGIQPPGQIGYDPASGNPSPAWTVWGYRLAIEQSGCNGSCRFNYVDAENLPCQNLAPAVISDGAEDSTTLTGLDGLT